MRQDMAREKTSHTGLPNGRNVLRGQLRLMKNGSELAARRG